MKKQPGVRKVADRRERGIAKEHGGKRVVASGSKPHAKEDVSFVHVLLQDKMTYGKSISIRLDDLEKLEEHAVMVSKIPAISFAIHNKKGIAQEWISFPMWWVKDQPWWREMTKEEK